MTAVVTDQRHRPQELLARVSPALYEEAYRAGRNLSTHLELLDPSEGYNDGLDAFGRLLRCANVRTRSLPELGLYADTFDALDATEQTRALAPEWLARQWRKATTGRSPSTRALYTSEDNTPGSAIYPYANAVQARTTQQIAPVIPLAELIAITTPITGGVYQAFYLQNNVSQQRMVRVAEGTEVPQAKLVGSNNFIRLRKFGRSLEVTYEQLRRMRFDVVALHIARMAVQSEADKVAVIIDTLVNGDGNSNSAVSYNLTTLDPAASVGAPTLAAWLAFKMKFANPYMATVALAQDTSALKLLLLNTGTANIPLVVIQGAQNLGSFRQINPGLADGVGLGWTGDAPSSKIVAFDSRFALEMVTEIGSNITEVEKYIRRQTQEIVMTETEGFAVFDGGAAKVLNLAA